MSIIGSDHDRPDATTAPGSATTPPSPRARGVRPLVMRLHFYAGLFIAPFLVIAAVSGGLYAVAPTAEQWVYRDYLHTSSTGPAAPLPDQVGAAQQVVPDLQVSAVSPATESGDTTRVLFADPTLGESERRAVFIDPVTATSHGTLAVYGSSGSLPMRTWISQLHRHLHLGEPGRIYSELAASWLWVIALGGLVLWIQRYRTLKKNTGNARLATVDRTAKGRRRTLNWHGAVGVWIVAGLVFLSATGLTWSRFTGENIGDLRQSLSWTTPEVSSSLSPSVQSAAPSGHAGHGGADTSIPADQSVLTRNVAAVGSALSTAHAVGVTGPVEVSIPADAESAMVVKQLRSSWQFEANAVSIDPANGAIVDESPFSAWPLAAKLSNWGIALHMGLLFGLANQLVLVAVAIGLVTLAIRGYIMWWRRRPTRRQNTRLRLPKPPGRGALRTVNPAVAVAFVVAAVAVGWFVPLLGISLLAFVVIDVAVGVYQRARHHSLSHSTSAPAETTTTKGA